MRAYKRLASARGLARFRAVAVTLLLSLASVGTGLVVWELLHAFSIVSPALVPGPVDLLAALDEIV